jgi:hypothetical protein
LQVPLWDELGLIDFPIDSYLNAVPLCPSCHSQFDCSIDPGLVLMPVDLHFFIDFEIDDRERRKKAAEEGLPSKRKAPTSEQYKQHQVANAGKKPGRTISFKVLAQFDRVS